MRPKIGTLTLSFANVAAYETFDPEKPFDSRLITHNLNRIWSPAWLDGSEDSVELRRAREMRPAVAAADHILDIHSTSQDVVPFWVYPSFERNAAVARRWCGRRCTWSCRSGSARERRSSSTARTGRPTPRARRSSSNAASTSSRRPPTSRPTSRRTSSRTSA